MLIPDVKPLGKLPCVHLFALEYLSMNLVIAYFNIQKVDHANQVRGSHLNCIPLKTADPILQDAEHPQQPGSNWKLGVLSTL